MKKKLLLFLWYAHLLCSEAERTDEQIEDEMVKMMIANVTEANLEEDDEIGTLDGHIITTKEPSSTYHRYFKFTETSDIKTQSLSKKKKRFHTLLSALDLLKLSETRFQEGDIILTRTATQQSPSLSYCLDPEDHPKQTDRPGTLRYHTLHAGPATLYASYDHPGYNPSDLSITIINKFKIEVKK